MPTPDRSHATDQDVWAEVSARLVRDYSRSRAVLVGTWQYAHLPPVPAAEHSLGRMADLLTGDLCGWPADRVTVIPNRARPGDLPYDLVELFSDTASDGVALFYFVGHGQPDDQDRLCLGLVDTRVDSHFRSSTSLRFEDVREALRSSPAKTKIVILDCCFAGLAARSQHTLSSGDMLDMTRGTGAYTMAASGAYSTAWFQTDGHGGPPLTYFTRYLVDVVNAGILGEPGGLTLDRIFAQVQDALVRDGKPQPTSTVRHEAGRFVFALNSAPAEAQGDQEAEITRLRAQLAALNEQILRLQAQEAENERRMAFLRPGQEVPQEVALQAGETATAMVSAAAERRRIADALGESTSAADGVTVADAVRWLSVLRNKSALYDAQVWLDAAAQLPVPELVELVLALNPERVNDDGYVPSLSAFARLNPQEAVHTQFGEEEPDEEIQLETQQVEDVGTILRLAGQQRPLREVADLVWALREAGEAAVTNPPPNPRYRHPAFETHVPLRSQPMAEIVLWATTHRSVDEIVDLMGMLRDDDVKPVLWVTGWSSPIEKVAELAEALHARGWDEDVRVLLRQAGGRDEGLPELIAMLDRQGRADDLVSLLSDVNRDEYRLWDPPMVNRRRELTRALRQTSLSRRVWHPLLRKQIPLLPPKEIARLVSYGVASLLVGTAAGAGDATMQFGLGNWAAFLASTGLVAAAAVLGYALVRRIVRGPREIFLTVPTLGWIPMITLFAIVLIGVFVAGYVLVPGAVGASMRDWFGWRF